MSHVTHCCHRHGCKYADLDCCVALGTDKQEYPCEYCMDEDHILIAGFHHWLGADSIPKRVSDLIRSGDGYLLPMSLLKALIKDYDVQLSRKTIKLGHTTYPEEGLILMLDSPGGGHRQR